MDLIIVTGLSGAGKTTAMDALEDAGFFCVDNVPPQMLGKLVELHGSGSNERQKMALGIDTRSFESFGNCSQTLLDLKKTNMIFQILFLDAGDRVLLNRYKENRRNHPLVRGKIESLEEAIEQERRILDDVRISADYIIDTSFLTTRELKNQVADYVGDYSDGLVVQCISFGFKFGLPLEPDLVFDVRCLPNPYYIPELKEKTGMDQEVKDFVLSEPDSRELLDKLKDLLDFLYPLYKKEGKTRLVVAIGCTGGKHRSVTFVEEIAKHLREEEIKVITTHRDKERKK